MFGDSESDADLRDTWHRFCDELRDAGELIFRDTTPGNPVTRATGLRLLARNVSLGLQFELENNDPHFPQLMHYFDPVRKQGGDNADALYQGAPINGVDTFRISGHRGDAAFFAITVLESGETPWGGGVVGTLLGQDLEVDEDGRFELVLSPEPHPGNWLRTTPDTCRVTFRQFFADWENEQRMEARIERLDAGDEVPPVFTPEQARAGLLGAARWVTWSTQFWADKIDLWQARRNEFVSYGELEDQKIDYTPAGTPLIAYWRVPPGEALIVRVTPPVCRYWNCEFGNYWWETMDYRQRFTSLNSHYAHLEADGSLVVIISHDDPGRGNWLDPCGHEDGYLTFRWMDSEDAPRPGCEQVARRELEHALGDAGVAVSPAQRRRDLQARQRGIHRRFSPL